MDSALKDGRFVSSPGARSLPVPITNRTRSLDRYSSSETNLNCSPYYQDQFSRPGSAPGLMYGMYINDILGQILAAVMHSERSFLDFSP